MPEALVYRDHNLYEYYFGAGSSIDDKQSSADDSSELEADSLAAAVIQEADRLEAAKEREEQDEGNNMQYEFQPQVSTDIESSVRCGR